MERWLEILPMFSKLVALSPRGLACPECGVKLEKSSRPGDEVLTCDHCGTKASLAEWASNARQPTFVGRTDRPPVTNIRRETTPDGTVWHIPAQGKFGFFMFFGVVWSLITAVLSGAFLTTFLTGGEIEGDMPEWFLIPFFGLFWGIGLVMVYFGIREKWLSQRLSVDPGELVLRREMFGRHREKRLAVADIRSVEQKQFYQKNDQPVSGIEIKAAQGKLRFGSSLTPEEKAWLVTDLREVIFGSQPVSQPVASEHRSGHFSVEIPNASKHLWPMAVILMLMGVTFIFVGLKFLDDRAPLPSPDESTFFATVGTFFNVMSNSFQSLWVLMAALMACGGLVLTVHLVRSHNLVRKLEGNDLEVALRSYRHGRVWKEKTFPRQEITDIRASDSGTSNGKSMKRIELIIGDKVEPLARWIDGDAADTLVAEVRASL